MKKFNKEKTLELIKAAQSGDESAKTKLIEENFGLVLSIAKRFYGRGYDADDINQLGAIGLLRAIEKFDTSQDVMFSTYAVPVILGEIKRFLRDDGPIKVSRSIKQTASAIAHFVETEQKSGGEAPKVTDIASALGIDIEDVIVAQEATQPLESIFSMRDNGERKLEDFLKTDNEESDILTKLDIKIAISSLPQKEQAIIIMRYFFDKTQKEVAKKIGVSQVQVSRLEKKILEKLRAYIKCE